MIELNISIERNGSMIPVGTITGKNVSDSFFQYDGEYCRNPEATALSISLPLQNEPFSPARTARFFDGLLPEGFTRRSVAQWMHVDESNYLSILHGFLIFGCTPCTDNLQKSFIAHFTEKPCNRSLWSPKIIANLRAGNRIGTGEHIHNAKDKFLFIGSESAHDRLMAIARVTKVLS